MVTGLQEYLTSLGDAAPRQQRLSVPKSHFLELQVGGQTELGLAYYMAEEYGPVLSQHKGLTPMRLRELGLNSKDLCWSDIYGSDDETI